MKYLQLPLRPHLLLFHPIDCVKKIFLISFIAIAAGCGKKQPSPSSSGIITTYAGNGTQGYSGDGGPATAAELGSFASIASDISGNVYITDGSGIRMVSTSGTISTIADNGAKTPSGAIAVDNAGNIYISILYSVERINTSGIITTIIGMHEIAGFIGDGGPASAGEISGASSLATDNAGNLYIADYRNGRIRKIDTAGIITTIAGNGSIGYSGDGGQATAAEISPLGIAIDQSGNIYTADQSFVRKINTTGIINTIAGNINNTTPGFYGDGGPATAAEFNNIKGLATDNTGDIYIVDGGNQRVRMVSTSGIISTFAGGGTSRLGDGGSAIAAELLYPAGIAVDKNGNVFIGDEGHYRIRKVSK